MKRTQAHRKALGEVSRRLGVLDTDFEQVCKIAYVVTDKQHKWGWWNAATKVGTLDKGQCFADLVTEALMYVAQGHSPRDAVSAAVPSWSAEMWAQGCVKQVKREDGTNDNYVFGLVPDPTVGDEVIIGGSLTVDDYAQVDALLDAEALLALVRSVLTDDEWELMVKLDEYGGYYALGPAVGMTPNGVRNKVRKVREKLSDLGISL